MGWGRMDDRFDEHPKVIAILDHEDPFAAAMAIGTWTVCFSWAHRNTRKRGQTPGLVPPGLPKRYFGRDARVGIDLLVKHGLWEPHESGGWLFHDFEDYLPTESTRDARSEAGKRGAAKRWAGHQKAGDSKASQNGKLPSGDGNLPSASHEVDSKAMASDGTAGSNGVATDGSRAPARRAIPKGIAPTPIPDPTPEDQNLTSAKDTDADLDDDLDDEPDTDPKNDRDDINAVCQHLADRIVGNGSKRPTIGKRWRDAARLMIDRDKRTVDQIIRCIDWCQDDEFWRANILSMPKLRKQYDQLRLAAQRSRNHNGRASPPNSGANKHNDAQDRRPTIVGVRSSDVLAEQAARGDR